MFPDESPGFVRAPANFRPDPAGLARAAAWVDAHRHELHRLDRKALQRRLAAAAWELLEEQTGSAPAAGDKGTDHANGDGGGGGVT